jgi:26S proteasome regulatory subunit N6
MILDRKFFGILDQGKGHLIIYDTSSEDKSFNKAFEIVENLGVAVETLYSRAKNVGRSVM